MTDTRRRTADMAKLIEPQETDTTGVTLPAGTVVTPVEGGGYVDADGRLCWPKPDEVSEDD